MLKEPLSITALASISSLGENREQVWNSYTGTQHCLSEIPMGDQRVWASPLPPSIKESIAALRLEPQYRALDDSVLFAIYTARRAVAQAGWGKGSAFGINIGSSRGATTLFERHHQEFLASGKASTQASPSTTLGNISSWVAQDLGNKGPEISHSITCSTALHAILNAAAWIQAGFCDKFLAGGSEAPLTPFTIAQMQALKVYSRDRGPYPCRALDLDKKNNGMVLGEAAGLACMERGARDNAMALLLGIGYATEALEHSVSLSGEGLCLQDSMKMALGGMDPGTVDAVVMHAPGTIKGDLSEYRAIQKIFGGKLPFLTTNKWKVGHSFGASGLLSLEMAILMLQRQRPIPTPFHKAVLPLGPIRKVLVNAVGFGGNAVSVLLGIPRSGEV